MRRHIPPEIKRLALKLVIIRKYPYKKILHITGVSAPTVGLCFFAPDLLIERRARSSSVPMCAYRYENGCQSKSSRKLDSLTVLVSMEITRR